MLHYGLDIYGAADTYAFSRMVRPGFGAALKIEDGRHCIEQQRYIGDGNALTSRSVGAGIRYRW